MTYNFDQCPDRRGTESVKWDLYPGTLPLWVADMDFKVAPEIQAALQKRLAHGVFGYELVPDSYFEAMHRWFKERHGWDDISKSNIVDGDDPLLQRLLPGHPQQQMRAAG